VTASPAARWLWLLPEARRALETRELAVILRCYRKFAGLSQTTMGELLGYDPSYVSLLERRQRTINDRQGLPHINRVLGVPPHVLGITNDEDVDFLAALQFGESTVRPAAIARQAGRAAEVVEELWPMVVRLEARLSEGRVDYGTASLLARARATLGTSLGHVLRMHGNELRKAGRSGAVIACLAEAAEPSHDEGGRGEAFVLLARAGGEQGDAGRHDEAVAAADLLMDAAGPRGILFTPLPSARSARARTAGNRAYICGSGIGPSSPRIGGGAGTSVAAIEAVTCMTSYGIEQRLVRSLADAVL
jgi:transcriptional regulator with XRE-family HTH domain